MAFLESSTECHCSALRPRGPWCWPAAEQTIELPLGNAIALARAALQAAAIDDRDVAAAITDQAGALQAARRGRDAGALHPQHHGEELLGEQKLVRLHAIVRHQHPAAASLLEGMKMNARGGLRDLIEDGVAVALHHGAHRGASRELTLEQRRRHSQASARNLHVDAGGRLVVAPYEREAHHAFVADRTDLGRLPVR